ALRFVLSLRRRPRSTLFPYTTLFRSGCERSYRRIEMPLNVGVCPLGNLAYWHRRELSWDPDTWRLHNGSEAQGEVMPMPMGEGRSEEHTSELQSRGHLVCRLLLEKKK